MLMEVLPYIFLIIWFVIMMILPWLNDYKRLITGTMVLTGSFTLYAILETEYAAASVTGISFIAVLAQLLLPVSDNPKNKIMRNLLAIIFSVIAVILLFEKPIDILPCLGSAIIRISEAQQSLLIAKGGYTAGIILWAIFGFYAELYLMCFLQMIILCSYLSKLLLSNRNIAKTN